MVVDVTLAERLNRLTAPVAPFGLSECVRRERDAAASKMQSLSRGLLMDWAKHGVKIVRSGELDLNTPQTSGMTRAAAITHARAGASKLWAGTMVVQADAKT